MSISIIINPIAGGKRQGNGRRRAELAMSVVEARAADAEIFVTERGGHARELARAAAGRGGERVVVWGGDGTVNEVAAALAFGDVPMGIVPAGSGNGLARELGVPPEPAQALAMAITASPRPIDVGEIADRLFVNVAGVGLDAEVAAHFSAGSNRRRGLVTYLWLTTRSLLTYRAGSYTVTVAGEARRVRALLVTVANGKEFGNGVRIAPGARVDDGAFDIVVVEERSRLHTLGQVPWLLLGRIDRSRSWSLRRGPEVTIDGDQPLLFHVDGEPVQGGRRLSARIHPGALRVCC